MATRIIDLSSPLVNGAFEPWPPEISFLDHREGARIVSKVMGLSPDALPEGTSMAWENFTGMTHTGTHLDAPWHFGPTSEGKPAKTIDQVPLEWCFSDGVRLDFTHKKPGETITADDVKDALKAIGYQLKSLDMVFFWTGASKYLDDPTYGSMHAGPNEEALMWILDQGIKVVGIDAYTFDRPFKNMIEDFKAGKKEALLPCHYAGRKREYCHLEKLANLEKIPRPCGFKAAVFPINIPKASAGWVRAVAIVQD